MSSKRLLGITVFGLFFIAALICVMVLTSFFGNEGSAIPLPPPPPVLHRPAETEVDELNRVEINSDTVQAVVSTLSRPEFYSRSITVEKFWQDGHAEYGINASVTGSATSLSTLLPDGTEKRIIVTADRYFIWYSGDAAPFVGDVSLIGGADRLADEFQMIVTYEDLLPLDSRDIIDAGVEHFNGSNCVYAVYISPLLRYTKRYYVSIETGLVVGATEHDETGELVYRMTAGSPSFEEIDPIVFALPDGSNIYEVG